MSRIKQIARHIDPGFFVVLTICLIAIWPFISRPGLPQETDAELHVFRLHELSYLVRGGEIYPRWAPNFYHAYGYPIFNYYAPLTYYLGLGVELWPWFDAVDGVKSVFVLGMLAAALGMYGFVRDNWGRKAGYVAAAVYIYSPYIQYIDPHARGVLAEVFSFGVFPLALWSLDRLRREGGARHLVAAVVTIAAVILSHNLMALLFFSLLATWAIWMNVIPQASRTDSQEDSEGHPPLRSRGNASRLFLALLFGLGLAAFFWLPVYLEREAVNLNTLIGQDNNFDFRTHFLSWPELLAFSKRFDWAATDPDIYFNLGVAQWLLGGSAILLLLGRRLKKSAHAAFFALSFMVLLFLMLPISAIVWERVPFLPYFQFPWRLLGPAASILAILGGAAAATLFQFGERFSLSHSDLRIARYLTPPWTTAVFVIVPILFGLPLSQPIPWPDFGEVNTLRMSLIEHHGRWLGTTSTSDFVPSTVEVLPSRKGMAVRGFYEGFPPDRINRAEGMIPEGATVEMEIVRPLKTLYHVSTPNDFKLRLFLFDFPGWVVRIDGEVVETELALPEGFIVIPVSTGERVVEVKFGTTPARTLAVTISGLSLLLTILTAWKISRDRKRVENSQSGIPELPSQHHSDFSDGPLLGIVLGVTAVHLLLLQPLGWLHYDSALYTAEPAEVNLFADFGEQIALIGYDVSDTQAAPGETVDVALYWQAQQPLEINFQVFLHLMSPEGALVAQSDKINPGQFPTKRWPQEKYVQDEHSLLLPPDLPPGEYAVTTGLWVQSEGWRLPLLDGTGQQIGDNYQLFTLVFE